MDQRRPNARPRALDFDLDDGANACGVNGCESEVVWPTVVSEPDIDIAGCGARYAFVSCWDHAVGKGAVALEAAHGDVGEVEVDTASWERTAVFKVDFTTVVSTRPTTPFTGQYISIVSWRGIWELESSTHV